MHDANRRSFCKIISYNNDDNNRCIRLNYRTKNVIPIAMRTQIHLASRLRLPQLPSSLPSLNLFEVTDSSACQQFGSAANAIPSRISRINAAVHISEQRLQLRVRISSPISFSNFSILTSPLLVTIILSYEQQSRAVLIIIATTMIRTISEIRSPFAFRFSSFSKLRWRSLRQ